MLERARACTPGSAVVSITLARVVLCQKPTSLRTILCRFVWVQKLKALKINNSQHSLKIAFFPFDVFWCGACPITLSSSVFQFLSSSSLANVEQKYIFLVVDRHVCDFFFFSLVNHIRMGLKPPSSHTDVVFKVDLQTSPRTMMLNLSIAETRFFGAALVFFFFFFFFFVLSSCQFFYLCQ